MASWIQWAEHAEAEIRACPVAGERPQHGITAQKPFQAPLFYNNQFVTPNMVPQSVVYGPDFLCVPSLKLNKATITTPTIKITNGTGTRREALYRATLFAVPNETNSDG
jgi:hypothetical protein